MHPLHPPVEPHFVHLTWAVRRLTATQAKYIRYFYGAAALRAIRADAPQGETLNFSDRTSSSSHGKPAIRSRNCRTRFPIELFSGAAGAAGWPARNRSSASMSSFESAVMVSVTV
jgi:hypothetical protein